MAKEDVGAQQAFPTMRTDCDPDGEPLGVSSTGGLTKREFLAAMALVGHMAGPSPQFDTVAAARCVTAADRLLEELRKGNKDG